MNATLVATSDAAAYDGILPSFCPIVQGADVGIRTAASNRSQWKRFTREPFQT